MNIILDVRHREDKKKKGWTCYWFSRIFGRYAEYWANLDLEAQNWLHSDISQTFCIFVNQISGLPHPVSTWLPGGQSALDQLGPLALKLLDYLQPVKVVRGLPAVPAVGEILPLGEVLPLVGSALDGHPPAHHRFHLIVARHGSATSHTPNSVTEGLIRRVMGLKLHRPLSCCVNIKLNVISEKKYKFKVYYF